MPYYNKNYNNLPKKPVKSFMDLEVYQKALEINVFVCNTIIKAYNERLAAEVVRSSDKRSRKRQGTDSSTQEQLREWDVKEIIIKTMLNCACGLPHLIAEAHSCRFGSQTTCLALLEKVMLNCNKMMVYLEQTRDICETGLEWEKFDETIKKYMYLRRKVLNLQRAWKKYMRPVADIDVGR